MEEYQNRVAEIDWTSLLESDKVNAAYTIFEDKIKGILDSMAPLRINQFRKKRQQMD